MIQLNQRKDSAMNFDDLVDTKSDSKKNHYHTLAIPYDINIQLDIICKALNCKKNALVNQALLNMINEFKRYSDE